MVVEEEVVSVEAVAMVAEGVTEAVAADEAMIGMVAAAVADAEAMVVVVVAAAVEEAGAVDAVVSISGAWLLKSERGGGIGIRDAGADPSALETPAPIP